MLAPYRLPHAPPGAVQANRTVVNVQEDFSDLERQLLPLLKDVPRAQVSGGQR